MLQDQIKDISETNHHIAFLKDCNDKGRAGSWKRK